MRFAHLADLHIGKKFNELSLIEDQKHILAEIVEIISAENLDAVLISGDVYDKAQSQAFAVDMLSDFLAELSKLNVHVLMIAGNHDAPSRLAYAKPILKNMNIHLAGKLEGLPEVLRLYDEYGPVNFVLLPFFRLHEIKVLFPEAIDQLQSYTDATRFILESLNLPENERKVILSHQFWAGIDPVKLSESELDIVGGLDAIDVKLLADYSYGALGHIHRPQRLTKDYLRYAGSPLAYSFSEMNQRKSVPIVELGEFGETAKIELRYLNPIREVRELNGNLEDILREARDLANSNSSRLNDILRVNLTDAERPVDPMRRLQSFYPNIVQLRIERDYQLSELESEDYYENFSQQSFIDLFRSFYQLQQGIDLSEKDAAKLEMLWNELRLKQETSDREVD